MLNLVESLESVPQHFIVILDTALTMFTAERMFCCYSSLTVVADVREKK